MLEVVQQQTAEHLKQEILKTLESYGVTTPRIFSVTVDNGANMIAAVKKMKQEREYEVYCELESAADSNDATEEFSDELITEFQKCQARDQLNLVRCALHTLQLAILDVVDKSNDAVKHITSIAKSLKSIKYRTYFECRSFTYPPVWSQTRWCGIYKMMESFKNQKGFFEQLGQHFPELGNF